MMDNQTAPQGSSVRSYQCSHCVLIFKTKLFLLEHLSNVHGFNVEAALKDAGLTSIGTDKSSGVSRDTSSERSGERFVCQHCDFEACSWDIIVQHEKKSHKLKEDLIFYESKEKKLELSLGNQYVKTEEEEKETSFLVKGASKMVCASSSSRDLKAYKKRSENGTNFLDKSFGSSENSPENRDSPNNQEIPDGLQGTLILQDSHSNSNTNSDGVFKVTATSKNDGSTPHSYCSFLNDHLLNRKSSSPKSERKFKEPFPNQVGKRTSIESSRCSPAKKTKLDEEVPKLPGTKVSKWQLASNTAFSYKGGENEERKVDVLHEETENSRVYFCKHCKYSDVGIQSMLAHYQTKHPYIRCNAEYIQNQVDQSATFCCLECPFECFTISYLEEHYVENHPQSLKSIISPCKDVKNAPSPQHSTSKGVDVALYQCINCSFSHKSVVVMHVHYQKSHPDEEVTIDKIKLSAQALPKPKLQMTPEKILESPSRNDNITAMDNLPSEDNESDYSENTRDKDETPHKTPLPSLKLNLKLEAQKDHSGSSTKKNVELEEDNSESALPAKRKRRSTPLSSLSFIPKINMFYCQFCSYCNTNVKSVLGHHNAKHSLRQVVTTDDVVQYSVQVQNRKPQSEAETSAAPTASDASTVKQVVLNRDAKLEQKHNDKDTLTSDFNPYARAEDLFYCQKCNFAHPHVRGVLKHQSKLHPNLPAHTEQILTHTRMICADIKKSKSQAEKSFASTGLPLPLFNADDESKLFCYLCNFRQKTVKRVLQHYSKSHCGLKHEPKKIHLYSSLVHRKICKLHLETTENQEDKLEIDEKGGNEKADMDTPGKSASVSPSPSQSSPQTPKSIQCNRCTYNTQYPYLLKRHIQKIHKSNRTITAVLKMGFRQRALQSGYHCEICAFSHKKAAVVYRHLKELHPGRGVSLEYVVTRLYVGLQQSPHKKNLNSKDTDGNGDCDNSDEQCEESKTKIYSCKACSYKDSSLSSMKSHYWAVHPWSVKEDGSILDVINSMKQSGNWQDGHDSCDTSEGPPDFDAPDVSSQASESSGSHKCHFCSMSFQTQRGLNIHCSLKHSEALTESVNEPEGESHQSEQAAGVHIFQCPYCTYVNTIYQGVLTHCQMMHSDRTARAESIQLDETRLPNVKLLQKTCPDGRTKFCGYMCKNCPAVYESSKKLKKHSEKFHSEAVPDMQSSTPEPSKPDVKLSDCLNTQGSKLQPAVLKKKKYAVIKCEYCKYTTTTKLALSRHESLHHKNAPVLDNTDGMYKCELCSRLFSMKHHLGCHYTNKHGKLAFLKYYVPLYQQHQKKPTVTSPESSVAGQPKACPEKCASSVPTEEKKIVYKCPRCAYVNTSHHGTLTHCQMLHPSFVARTDNLQTEEILTTKLLRCRRTKGSNRSGYACKICPEIVASTKNLRKHYEKDHSQTVSNPSKAMPKHSVVFKKQLLSKYHNSQRTGSKAAFFKNKKIGLNQSLDLQNKSASGTVDRDSPYTCALCGFSSTALRNLRIHCTHKHGKDAILKCAPLYNENLLESASAKDSAAPASESATETCESDTATVRVECRKCPDVFFNSFQLLSAHYVTFHSSDCKLDFIMLPRESKTKRTYKCGYCKKKLHGTRKLSRHLDRHREWNIKKPNDGKARAPLISESEPEAQYVECNVQDELPTFESVSEMIEAAPVEHDKSKDSDSGSLVSRSPSPSSHTDEGKSQEDKHACKYCGRTYVFLSCLRMHERSHAAVAALNRQDSLRTSLKQQTFSKYILYRRGNTRPFLCGICSYRTTVIGLLKSHFVKKHGDVILDLAETENQSEESTQMSEEKSCSSVEVNSLSDLDEEAEDTEKSQYLEPPDVQRQLDQYSLMAQASATANMNLQENRFFEDSLLYCEFCNFQTEHLSSIRRHYVNRHGKKIHKCKDCCFYTGLRNKLESHMADGHSTWQSRPTHEKDLRCPFCLYRSKNKNNMIDHIVLHRDERVVPIEVRRPKLSRYLQGLIFRCHKCTFTSGSAENLCEHMKRHDDVKPFSCRLCYFDCIQLSDLEAHLCDKHQVLRNHELVGQISLDQLAARVRKMSEEDEPLSNPKELGDVERETNGQWQDVVRKTTMEEKGANQKNESCNAQYDDVPHQTKDKNIEENCIWDIGAQDEGPYQKQVGLSKNGNSGNPAESCFSTIHCESDATPSAVVQIRLEPHSRDRERTRVLTATVKEHDNEWNKTEDGKSNPGRMRDAKKEEWMDGSQEQPEEGNGGDGISQSTEAAAGGISSRYYKRVEPEDACETYHGFQKRKIKTEPDLESEAEDHILRQILLLDEEGSIPNLHTNGVHRRTIKVEQDIESSVEDDLHQQAPEPVEGTDPKKQCEQQTTCIKPMTAKKTLMAKNIRVQECFTAEKHWLSAGVHNCELFKKSHQRRCDHEVLGVSFTNRKEEQVVGQNDGAELTDPYGEMPILEKEYVREKMCLFGQNQEEEANNHFKQKQTREEEMNSDNDKSSCKDQGYKEGVTMKEVGRAADGAADIMCPPAEAFTCTFCGRHLLNSSELERHTMRHGL